MSHNTVLDSSTESDNYEDMELSSRESPLNSSSSSSSFVAPSNIVDDDLVWKGKEEEEHYAGESLLDGYKRVYSIDYGHVPPRYHEVIVLNEYPELIKLINSQKVYHQSGILREFEESVSQLSRHSIEKIQSILVRRGLLNTMEWSGKSRSTFGMVLYVTNDCTKRLVQDYLTEYRTQDRLRYEKEKQRQTKKKTPEEVVQHNQKVKELSARALKPTRVDALDEERSSCNRDYTHHIYMESRNSDAITIHIAETDCDFEIDSSAESNPCGKSDDAHTFLLKRGGLEKHKVFFSNCRWRPDV